MSAKDKTKWMKVLVPDFMSSEYSTEDSADEDILVTRQLMWRSQKVQKFFHELDSHCEEMKSKQAKKQTKNRALSDTASTRPPPTGNFPNWARTQNGD